MNRTSTALAGPGTAARPARPTFGTKPTFSAKPTFASAPTLNRSASDRPSDRPSSRPGRSAKRPKKPQFRKLVLVDPESLARALETRSQIAPAQPLDEAVRKIAEDVGAEGPGVDRVIGWATEFGRRTVGDLKRIDRMKLAREMYRLWRPGAPVSAGF